MADRKIPKSIDKMKNKSPDKKSVNIGLALKSDRHKRG